MARTPAKASKAKKTGVTKHQVAKIKGDAVKTKFAELIDLLFRPGAREAGQIMKNEFKYFKFGRLLKLNDKLKRQLDRRQVSRESARPLPQGIGTRMLERASEEDDDEVLDMWAKLMASGLDPNEKSVDKVFVGVIADLGGLEALILRFMWLRIAKNDTTVRLIGNEEVATFGNNFLRTRDTTDRSIAIQNLVRLRCLRLAVDEHVLQRIGVESTDFILSNPPRTGRAGGDVLSETRDSINAIRQMLEDLAGLRDPVHLGLEHDGGDNAEPFPEISFELTELGAELMRRCER